MARYWSFTLYLVAAVVVYTIGGVAFSQSLPSNSRFRAAPTAGSFVPATRPIGIGGRRVKVIVKMASDPVAVVRSRAAQKQLSATQRAAAEDAVEREQQAVMPLIEGRGGRILARYRDAVNGIKVEIDRSEIASLRAIPNVVAVTPVAIFHKNNATSVPFLGVPALWQGVPGITGAHVKVAIIDTGIDYTHADFGGPGTPAAFVTAAAHSADPADPKFFGPQAPKVKGGIDFVGDDYDPSSTDPSRTEPHPDANPLDCNGHGSHVAGTVAGFGVTSTGQTYRGPYDTSTYSHTFSIGPGVAPAADLYAVRVFGCDGTTDLVIDAIDWAVQHDMQVINLSLGSTFGSADDTTAEAADNAAKAGVIVVVAAGNDGPSPYIVGSPATATRALAIAAIDTNKQFPGAALTLSTGATLLTQDSNGGAITDGMTLPVYVLRDADGNVSLGCNDSEYVDSDVAGKLVVTMRGVCSRTDRATFGMVHGALAVAMINSSDNYPPFEGDILGVAIPFLGVRGTPESDGALLVAADRGTATLTSTVIANAYYRAFADFTSAGPRLGDSILKPSVTAPGVSIVSAAVGTGTGRATMSGTSMATPHVAGVAALVAQAHSGWSADDLSSAIVTTADASLINGYWTSLGGSGLVQPLGAARTSTVLSTPDDSLALNFGFAELTHDYRATRRFTVRNLGRTKVTFNVSVTPTSGIPHELTVSQTSVTVRPSSHVDLSVALQVPSTSIGDASEFREVAGLVTLTPATPQSNSGVALRLPYYLVPRARSNVSVRLDAKLSPSHPTATAMLSNPRAPLVGSADFYAWGLAGTKQQLGSIDLRAVGVQSVDFDDTKLLVFAVNTYERWSNAATGEFDIYLDTNGDGVDEFALIGIDNGLLTVAAPDGQMASALIDLTTGGALVRFFAYAPTDGSTLLLPVLAGDLGITVANPRLSYTAASFSEIDTREDSLPGSAVFDAYASAISQGQFALVDPDTTATVPVSIDPYAWATTPALGLMVVTFDNKAGAKQAHLLPVWTKNAPLLTVADFEEAP